MSSYLKNETEKTPIVEWNEFMNNRGDITHFIPMQLLMSIPVSISTPLFSKYFAAVFIGEFRGKWDGVEVN